VNKRRSKKTEAKVSNDPIAELVAEDKIEDEFPDGFVWFSSPTRWFGQYVVDGSITVTGKGYIIERAGTKVDIKDMELLKAIRESVYCEIQGKHIEVAPIGVTSV
jgi:hypothetical protein